MKGRINMRSESVGKVRDLMVLGLGCTQGAAASEVISLAESVLASSGRALSALSCVASLRSRVNEPAICAAAKHFGVPLRAFGAARLEAETARLANPSDKVFARTGCHGVAEAAALAGAGPDAVLIVEKTRSAHATAAVAACSPAMAVAS